MATQDADRIRDLLFDLRMAGRACVGGHAIRPDKLRLLLGRAERAIVEIYPEEQRPRGRFGGQTPPAAARVAETEAEQLTLV